MALRDHVVTASRIRPHPRSVRIVHPLGLRRGTDSGGEPIRRAEAGLGA